MKELVVIIAGLLLGAGAAGLSTRSMQLGVLIVGAVVVGTAWSRIVGEHELLALWDITQALVAGAAGLVLTQAIERRRATVP